MEDSLETGRFVTLQNLNPACRRVLKQTKIHHVRVPKRLFKLLDGILCSFLLNARTLLCSVRMVLSNKYGSKPLVIGAAHVALAGSGAAIVAGPDRALTFDGHPSVTIPPGATVFGPRER